MLFSIVFQLYLYANKGVASCDTTLWKKNEIIHSVVTGRQAPQIWGLIEKYNESRYRTGVHGIIPPINLLGVLEGTETLLSLGEGRSTFVLNLLNRLRKKSVNVSGVQAVDVIYKAVGRYRTLEDWEEKDFQSLVMAGFSKLTWLEYVLKAFPNNFHQSTFLELDLRVETKQLQFDQIISSNALSYILARKLDDQSLQTTMLNDIAVLKNVLRHLRSGGSLLIWPVLEISNASISRFLHLQRILNQLIVEGVIRNHNFDFINRPELKQDDWHENGGSSKYVALILQKY